MIAVDNAAIESHAGRADACLSLVPPNVDDLLPASTSPYPPAPSLPTPRLPTLRPLDHLQPSTPTISP